MLFHHFTTPCQEQGFGLIMDLTGVTLNEESSRVGSLTFDHRLFCYEISDCIDVLITLEQEAGSLLGFYPIGPI